ncbi:ABC transporter substrate-binding protein [Ruminiclostridium cellobioparum]|uniref:ABC transporter substrate-binding protein n=1 Tax=Ruminiclostridium cellobioparum TaxID=29355 RepID=UPI00048717FE|nr:ABC transporter substrate-binding protein [Ruminiclostridium cellobioparum]
MKKKLVSVLLCVILVTSMLYGCGNKGDNAAKDGTAAGSTARTAADGSAVGTAKYPEFITVDVFDNLANYQGIMSGWYAKIVKENFNMELNIIAPNVAGGGDTLFQTRSAAGELGDLIIIGAENGRMQDVVTAGLLYDATKLFAERKNITKYQAAIDSLNKMVEGDAIYGVPSLVSEQPATNPSEGLDLTFGPYLRWDAYKSIGYPQIKTLEDLIQVFKDMQKAVPASKTGKKTYAVSLFKDWDGNMMCMAKQPTCFYGYDELGFVLAKADGSDYQSIIDQDSMYNRVLKFYFDANQAGLVDPESTTQNYDTMYTKYQDGQILYAPWPWLGQSAFNTPDNKAAGIGFMIAPIDDMKVFSYGCNPVGNKTFIAIGSKAEDPERLADFIDWLYSPEGIQMSAAQTSKSSGPKGLTWDMADGKPALTEFGWKAFFEGGNTPVPTEWGGGIWKDGVSALNYDTVLPSDINPLTNYPYNYTLWDSVLEKNKTPLDMDWQAKMGASTTLEYLQKKNQIMVAPGSSYIAPAEDSEITALRGQCKAIIIENSWKMVFAANESEFNSLQKEMQDTVKGLGYDKVLAVDMKNAKDQNTAREASAAASK